MLNEMSSQVQRIWLSKAVLTFQSSDQMHLPATQTMLSEWTHVACNDKTTDADYAYNLARYWSHGLRFPMHSDIARAQIQKMLEQHHLCASAMRAVDTLLEHEIQPLRILRLWSLTHELLPRSVLAPHLERLLSAPLPTGKKLKLSQIGLHSWKPWLRMHNELMPAAFNAGMELHIRACLISRQGVDPLSRAANAWEMLDLSEKHLPLLNERSELVPLNLPRQLSILINYADSQTLQFLPWQKIQEHFVSQPDALYCIWQHIFQKHKTALLHILPNIKESYHPRILAWFLNLKTFQFETGRCALMLDLVRAFPAWTVLLNNMLALEGGYHTLGNFLLESLLEKISASTFPGLYFSELSAQQWTKIFRPEVQRRWTPSQLARIWEIVFVYNVKALGSIPSLQQTTMQELLKSACPKKINPWDPSLGLPAFCKMLLNIYLTEDETENWFIDWTENPSIEKMVVRAFQWFNPDIDVPPLSELLLLVQVLENANILTVLAHLGKNIETVELPSMLE